jgi:cytokinin riboside 5'-monophosphate phosphoribohydrolase
MAMEAAAAPEKSGGDGATGAGVVAAAVAAQVDRRSRFRRICVYCGSAKGRKPSYQDAAVELGRELVRNVTTSPRKNSAFARRRTP